MLAKLSLILVGVLAARVVGAALRWPFLNGKMSFKGILSLGYWLDYLIGAVFMVCVYGFYVSVWIPWMRS